MEGRGGKGKRGEGKGGEERRMEGRRVECKMAGLEFFYIFIYFLLNIFKDCIQPFGHEMLSRVRLRGINAHNVSPPAH